MQALKLDAYIRVSQVRGRSGDSFISPDLQAERIRAWATAHGHTIAAEHHELDVSGGSVNRPMLNEVMRRIEASETNGVVVYKLDRFGRTLVDSLGLIERIKDAGGTFASVSDSFDLGTEQGRLVLRIMLSLAEFELDRIRANWRDARSRAVARGVHIASRCPTGYVRRRDGRLEPHPEYGAVVAEVFERRAGGASWADLSRLLNERGVVGPYGAEQWVSRPVEHMIRNRAYLGEARHGEFVNATAHEPIVARELWEAAQRVQDGPVPRSSEPALLAGLLRCAGCRHVMKPDKQTMRDGTRARTYRCRGNHASGTCEARAMVLGSVVEPFVVAEFLAYADSVTAEPVGDDIAEEVAAAVGDLRAAEADLVAFRDGAAITVLGETGFLAGLHSRQQQVDAAADKVAALQSVQTQAGLPPAAELRAMWPELATSEKQLLLRAGLDVVFIRAVGQSNVPIAERTRVFVKDTAPADLPGRGRRNLPLVPYRWSDDPADAGVPVAEDDQERPLEAAAR